MNTMFVVTIRGEAVFHECSLLCYITDTTDATLDAVRSYVASRCNLGVYDFSMIHGVLCAWTSNKDVKVFIEEVYKLD